MLKVKTLKVNYILNITRTVLSTLIGLLVFQYVNKTLGVNAIGKYEYANSIITYFVLFSSLGIPMYGIREIARVRDNELQRTKAVIELLSILLITTIISYILLYILILNINSFNNYKEILILISPIIFLTNIGIEWFFQGIEDQMYITIRFIIVKAITLILLFFLVKTQNDVLIYASIMTFSTAGSNIFNFFYIKKFINLSLIKMKNLDLKKHLKGIITIFLATISVSIYLQMDNTLLGYLVGDKYVGLYSTSNKLIRFAILFITTLGSVMLPRLSYLYEKNEIESYNKYLQKTLKYILFISVPLSTIFFSFSDFIIEVMAGKEFIGSVIPMKILSPLVIIIGLAYFLAFMVLYPQGKEKLYTIVVFISAIVSITLNIILIPKYYHIATAWVNLIVELLGVILMIFMTRKELNKIHFFSLNNTYYFIGGLLMYGFIISINYI
ncbi:flippase, partial [Chishuiella sp.]|uniref:flippase n=1 Tax=Chishuiella sp. TaxID=1969467 RepID=UPI0028A624D7